MLRTCSEPDLSKLVGKNEPAEPAISNNTKRSDQLLLEGTNRPARSLEDLAEAIEKLEASEVRILCSLEYLVQAHITNYCF
jgi:hypothetical protein